MACKQTNLIGVEEMEDWVEREEMEDWVERQHVDVCRARERAQELPAQAAPRGSPAHHWPMRVTWTPYLM